MFSREYWQIKLAYAAFGFLLAVLGMVLSPVAAHKDKIGEIECTKLRVVDKDGNTMVELGIKKNGGRISAFGKDGKSMSGWL